MLPGHDLAPMMLREVEQAWVAEPEAEEPEAEEPVDRSYAVAKGGSLLKTAERFCGDDTRWEEIHQTYKDRIRELSLLRCGKRLGISQRQGAGKRHVKACRR